MTAFGRRLGGSALGWVLPLFLLLAWEAIARAGLVRATLLPPPAAVGATLWGLAKSGELAEHVTITLIRVLLGFALGTAAATVLGALSGYSETWRRLLDPTIQGLRSVPSIAWVPLFILWLGIFEASKVTLIAIGVFFPVYLNLMAGIRETDRKLVEVARVHGYRGLALVRRVLLPATLPAYVTGLRGGLGLGWMFVVAAEMMGASEGLGFLMIDGQQTGRPAVIITSLLLFAVLGKTTDLVLSHLGRRATRWQDSYAAAQEGSRDAADRTGLQAV
ncbi:MAG TPA: ABC transporter permease [Stellaceae bacterium]|nr:ABC transporter permease [Stellaceae bacterium]